MPLAVKFNPPPQSTPFGGPAGGTMQQQGQAAPNGAAGEELAPGQGYDILQDREKMNRELVNSQEIDDLVSTIEVGNMESIVTFGAKAAEEISRVSDTVLRNMSMSQVDDSTEMMAALARIMGQFDMDEITKDPGFWDKLLGGAKKKLEKILVKYNNMGDEVDKIYVELRRYETDIRKSNRKLEELFNANVGYYHELVKYILAGEQGCRELDAYIAQRKEDLARTGDASIQFELTTLDQAKMMLEQRTYDLKVAETVAMQSIPMLQTMAYTNMNLVRKINSAFIITLPVFKQALAQAILLKRQRLQAESLAALDQKTNEMLVKNARSATEQAKAAARMANGSGIKVETLEDTWKAIMNGIEETRRLQQDAKKQREEDQQRLAAIRQDFQKKYQLPTN